jgi:hypothetical protein
LYLDLHPSQFILLVFALPKTGGSQSQIAGVEFVVHDIRLVLLSKLTPNKINGGLDVI